MNDLRPQRRHQPPKRPHRQTRRYIRLQRRPLPHNRRSAEHRHYHRHYINPLKPTKQHRERNTRNHSTNLTIEDV